MLNPATGNAVDYYSRNSEYQFLNEILLFLRPERIPKPLIG